MELAKTAEVIGRPALRSDGSAYSEALAGPSQATGYSLRHCAQMYLPWIGHIGCECIFLHQSCETQFVIVFLDLRLRHQRRNVLRLSRFY